MTLRIRRAAGQAREAVTRLRKAPVHLRTISRENLRKPEMESAGACLESGDTAPRCLRAPALNPLIQQLSPRHRGTEIMRS